MKAAMEEDEGLSVTEAATLVAEEAVRLRQFTREELARQSRRFSQGFSELKFNTLEAKNHGNALLTAEQEAFLAGSFEGFALNGDLVDKAFMLSFTNFHYDVDAKDKWYFIVFYS
jgi:hypothetical protein